MKAHYYSLLWDQYSAVLGKDMKDIGMSLFADSLEEARVLIKEHPAYDSFDIPGSAKWTQQF